MTQQAELDKFNKLCDDLESGAVRVAEKTLVGIMQSTLFNPSKKEISNKQLVRHYTLVAGYLVLQKPSLRLEMT